MNESKQTAIGKIPKGWQVVALGSPGVAEVRGNRAIRSSDRVAFIPMELVPDQGIYCEYEVRNIDQVKSATYCEVGDLLLAKITPSLENGKQGIVPSGIPGGFAFATTEVFPIVCKGINTHYLFYVLKFPKYRNKLIGSMIGTTGRQRASKHTVDKLEIPLPNPKEQKKIAEILLTVDEGIGKVDEAIQKTERLRKGLMQQLLTKGIGHREFKQTEIGFLPEDWEVVKLVGLINDLRNGFASGKRDEKGIVQIRMNNITTDGHILLDSYLKVPAPESIDEWILKEGDFLFNNTNSIDLVGKSAIFKSAPFPCTYSNHFTRMRFKQDVLPDWVLYHFIILWRKGFFKSVAVRHVGQAAVHKDHLLKLRLPIPPLPEQKKIAEILSTVDGRSELLKKKRERLERIKRGLMNDLLTGKRRIKVVA